MKLLIVLSIKEYQDQIAKILEESGVEIFSVSRITGYKKRSYNIGWFGSDSGKTNSIMMFSFTEEVAARQALDNISKCNKEGNPFPVKGFVLNVTDQSI